jgi:putative nucleotidyltransferase with HDIG domain
MNENYKEQLKHPVFKVVSDLVAQSNLSCYVVGGYVRDTLLGRDSKDIDFVVVGNALDLAKAAADKLRVKKVSVFERFGTAHFRYKDLDVEFVGARKESYSEHSRKPVVSSGSLQDDQNRRDFTINAMGFNMHPENFGMLVDPFNGVADLKSGIIRTPLDPKITYSDDPLRMMRAIRFASQLNFKIESKSLQAIIENAERLAIISMERIIDELNKIILSPKPSRGFELLFNTKLLHQFFPEMVALQGVETINGNSHKDNFYHTLEVLDNLSVYSDNLWLRWAAILHDIAKPQTKRYDEKVGWTFHGHEDLGAKMVPRIFKRFRLPLDHKMKYVQKLVRLHLRPIALVKGTVTDSAVRRLLFEAGEDLEDLMKLCNADITSKNEFKVKKYRNNFKLVQAKFKELEEKDRLRNFQPPIRGQEIIETFNLGPCPEIGIIKTKIKDAIVDGLISNEYEPARELMLKLGEELGLKTAKNQK